MEKQLEPDITEEDLAFEGKDLFTELSIDWYGEKYGHSGCQIFGKLDGHLYIFHSLNSLKVFALLVENHRAK